MKKIPYLEHFRHLRHYLTLAGIKADATSVFIMLYVSTAAITVGLLFYLLYLLSPFKLTALFVITLTATVLTFGYALIFLLIWLIFLMYIDYKKFKRRTALESVLPEFLRLVSTNHRAGLPLDMSLWKANKPRFGVLAEEMNVVARKTYATGSLAQPLMEFSEKYDSALLRRVITNLLEGLKTGSDIAGLLDDIASNIITIRNTRKELASEVENYLLFITLTVLIISPFMFALTNNMAGIIEIVKNTLAEGAEDDTSTQSAVPFSFTATEDFKKFFDIFVWLMILTNSVISVLLMSMVRYGNLKQELKRIPVYYLIGWVAYTFFKMIFANFFDFF